MKVSWDDDIPNIWKNKNVPNHQPDLGFIFLGGAQFKTQYMKYWLVVLTILKKYEFVNGKDDIPSHLDEMENKIHV